MKLIFAGSPEYSLPALRALHEKFGVYAVITQPDRCVGRKKILTPCPVKAEAEKLGIPVYDFEKISAAANDINKLGADIMITCAYGQILPKSVLDIFPMGVWNLHASLLPKLRGASPIQTAILTGEKDTGVTVMKTELAMDTGDILLVKRTSVGNKTYGELASELSYLSALAAVEGVECILRGDNLLLMQDEARATYCKKIVKSDFKLDFSYPAEKVVRMIKAASPQPAAYCTFSGGILNIYNAEVCSGVGAAGEVLFADKRGICVACGSGAVIISELQSSGGKRISGADFANGRKIKAGDRLD